MGDNSPVSSGPTVMSDIDTPIPATSPVISPVTTTPYTVTSSGKTLPRRYRSLQDAHRFFSEGHNVVPTTGSFISQAPHTAVTTVPNNPTVCVAVSTPVVSAVTASSAVTSTAGPSRGPTQSGELSPSSRVVHPASDAPPVPEHMTEEEKFYEYLRNIQNLDRQGLYYDAEHARLYTSLPQTPFDEISVPLNVNWGTTGYGGGIYYPGQGQQGPPY